MDSPCTPSSIKRPPATGSSFFSGYPPPPTHPPTPGPHHHHQKKSVGWTLQSLNQTVTGLDSFSVRHNIHRNLMVHGGGGGGVRFRAQLRLFSCHGSRSSAWALAHWDIRLSLSQQPINSGDSSLHIPAPASTSEHVCAHPKIVPVHS